MTINKESKALECTRKEYGYTKTMKVGDTIYVSWQVDSDDSRNMVGLVDMETQMRQAYANIHKLLSQYEITMENRRSE